MAILGRGVTGLPLTTDSLIIGVGGVLDELPVGSLDQVLTVTATGVDWSTLTALGVTNINTGEGLTGGPITTTGTIDLAINELVTIVGDPSNSDILPIYDVSAGSNKSITYGTFRTILLENLDNIGDVSVGSPPSSGQDGYLLSWDDGAQQFVLTPPASVTGGTVTSIDVAGGSGLISSGGPVTVSGTITINYDINSMTPLGATPDVVDELVIFDVDAGIHKKVTISDLPLTSGEINTASNVGTGQGLFKQKTGVDFEFYSLLGIAGVDASLVGDGIELSLDFTNLVPLGGSPATDDLISIYDDTAGAHRSIEVGSLPFLQISNNLSDVASSQTAIDNLTNANTVTVDQLGFTEHGGDTFTWLIEEDSGDESLTFDYNLVEKIKFTITGGAEFGDDILLASGASIVDSSGNELFTFTETGSAVNQIDIKNNITGTRPQISTTGDDTTGTGLGLDIVARNSTTSGAGGTVLVRAGTAFGTGAGGALNLWSGVGGTTSGNGGAIQVLAGNSPAGADGNGGNVDITAGNNAGGSGDVGDGGDVTITSGNSVDGDGGAVTIVGGDGTDASTTSNVGGSIILRAGNGTGGATDGTIQLQNPSTETIIRVAETALELLPNGGGTATTLLRFYETTSFGANWVALRAASNISSNITWILPAVDGGTGDVLSTNGSGTLSWSSAGAGTVTSVNVVGGAGTGLSTTGGPITSSGSITASLDFSSLTAEPAMADGDYMAFFDSTAAGHRRILVEDLATYISTGFSFSLLSDTTPQLGGDLDVNGQSIISVSNGDIAITPDGTGNILLDAIAWPATDGTSGQVITTDGSGNLSFQTVASGTGVSVEDEGSGIPNNPHATLNFIGNSVTATDGGAGVADITISAISNVVEDAAPQLGGDLDVNGQSIVSISNGDIIITPDGSGIIILDGIEWPSLDGTAGQALVTDGSGTLSFTTITGGSGINNVIEDTTPQLGGDLDVNGQSIISTGSGDILITPDTGGTVIIDGIEWPIADGTAGQTLVTDGSGTLSFTTIVSGSGVSVEEEGSPIPSTPHTTLNFVGSSVTATDGGSGEATITISAISNIVEDITPQLGGDLDVNGQSIISVGGGDIIIAPDTGGSVIIDGIEWPIADGTPGQTLITNGSGSLSFADQEFISAMFIPGIGVDGSLLVQIVFTRDVDFDAGLPNSQVYANIAAHDATVWDLYKNDTIIGSIEWDPGANIGSFAFSGGVTFSAGDRLLIVNQNPADLLLADVSVSLVGTKI